MKRAVGPLDKRKAVTRCYACAKRHIKCKGGYPCEYCIRTHKTCQLQKTEQAEVKFISVQGLRAVSIPMQIRKDVNQIYLDYFVSFLGRCQFTRDFGSVTSDLITLSRSSPSLWHIAVATGALEASRRGSVAGLMGRELPQYVAFSSYGNAIHSLQLEISAAHAAHKENMLWSSFLLGIFELLTGASGDGWVKHMAFGTSKMLQLSGPMEQPTLLLQRLFDAFRMLEINRAILYGEATFLSQGEWPLYQRRVASGKSDGSEEPMEAVLTLMMHASSFSERLFSQVESIPEQLRRTHPCLDQLAFEGIEIQRMIGGWQSGNMSQMEAANPHAQLAIANCHALALFHSRNFTYYSCWADRAIPHLQDFEITGNVAAILHLSDRILRTSAIPGVSLLFALRMAGAHADDSNRHQVVSILDRIHQNGFIVSDKIKADLEELWQYQAGVVAKVAQPILDLNGTLP